MIAPLMISLAKSLFNKRLSLLALCIYVKQSLFIFSGDCYIKDCVSREVKALRLYIT
jgi:hypothetical protein